MTFAVVETGKMVCKSEPIVYYHNFKMNSMNLDDFFDSKGFDKKDKRTKQMEQNKIQSIIDEIVKPALEAIKNNINSRQRLSSTIVKAEREVEYAVDNYLLIFSITDLMNAKYGFKMNFLKKDKELYSVAQYGKFNIYNEIVRYDSGVSISIHTLTAEIIENEFKKAFNKLIK